MFVRMKTTANRIEAIKVSNVVATIAAKNNWGDIEVDGKKVHFPMSKAAVDLLRSEVISYLDIPQWVFEEQTKGNLLFGPDDIAPTAVFLKSENSRGDPFTDWLVNMDGHVFLLMDRTFKNIFEEAK